jgi:hypothetical protein
VLPQCLTQDVEPAGERRIAEAALTFPWQAGADGSRERVLRIDLFGLGLGLLLGTGRKIGFVLRIHNFRCAAGSTEQRNDSAVSPRGGAALWSQV